MAVTSKRERALQVVLVVFGLGTAGANMAFMAIQLPTKRGELLAGVAVTGLSALLLFVFARFATKPQFLASCDDACAAKGR
jgi:hypothetical protein